MEDGQLKLMDLPLTPADYAYDETRFKKQFRLIKGEVDAVPLHEYIDMPAVERGRKVPYILKANAKRELVKLEVGAMVVHLVEERRHNWRTLQHLAGQTAAKLDAAHSKELAAMEQKYKEALESRELSMDSIAAGMAENGIHVCFPGRSWAWWYGFCRCGKWCIPGSACCCWSQLAAHS